MGSRCGSYGFLGAFAAIASGVSYFILKQQSEKCVSLSSWGDLQSFHVAIIITGICVTIGSLFDVKSVLSKSSFIFSFVTGVLIAAVGCLSGYCAYLEFMKPCKIGGFSFGIDLNSLGANRNIFDASDEYMIGVFILDICACLLLVSGGFTFFS